jgi:ligand-binding sensor domain-containing protein
LSNNYVLSILEDKSGNLWFANYGAGVSIHNSESFMHFTEKEGLSNNRVRSILEDKSGNLWFGTNGAGVSMYDGESFTHFTEKEGLSNNIVLSILEDKNGNLWFGTNGAGVSMYDGESFMHFTEKEGLSNNIVRSILEDKNGNIWFGTNGAGVSMYDGESFTHFTEKEGLSNNIVLSILEDKKGNLWFGTNGGGVSVYDGKATNPCRDGTCNHDLGVREDLEKHKHVSAQSFTHYTEKEGLNNNIVYSILEDKNGNFWLSTENGLNKLVLGQKDGLQPQNLQKTKKVTLDMVRFDKNDGLKGLDFYSNSVCLDSKTRSGGAVVKVLPG